MSDLISREAFKRKLYEADCVDKYGFVNCGVTRINILLEQSAVDAVEVVRCDKCIYSNSCEIEALLLGDGIEKPYCAGGERREENAADLC